MLSFKYKNITSARIEFRSRLQEGVRFVEGVLPCRESGGEVLPPDGCRIVSSMLFLRFGQYRGPA